MSSETKIKIQKISSKGQVTLPASWRKSIKTDHIKVSVSGDKLVIQPARFDESGEYTVFDAIRDNKGKGLKVKDLQSILTNLE
jgi:bifunctional DNA-binding transcriptional regulator/antitoxin component of YhaV-PrlF toxin-antitoxin module